MINIIGFLAVLCIVLVVDCFIATHTKKYLKAEIKRMESETTKNCRKVEELWKKVRVFVNHNKMSVPIWDLYASPATCALNGNIGLKFALADLDSEIASLPCVARNIKDLQDQVTTLENPPLEIAFNEIAHQIKMNGLTIEQTDKHIRIYKKKDYPEFEIDYKVDLEVDKPETTK